MTTRTKIFDVAVLYIHDHGGQVEVKLVGAATAGATSSSENITVNGIKDVGSRDRLMMYFALAKLLDRKLTSVTYERNGGVDILVHCVAV